MDMEMSMSSNKNHEFERSEANPLEQVLKQFKRASTQVQKEWTSCIYGVPWCLKGSENNGESPFRPQLVSIGPYHYGDARLEGMQVHKYRMLDRILERTEKSFDDFLKIVKDHARDARACYGDLSGTKYPEGIFEGMLVLDGCFTVEFLVGCYDENTPYTELGYHKDDPVFSQFYIYHGIHKDMLLFENQIPIFILNALYNEIQYHPSTSGQVSNDDHKFLVNLMFKAFTAKWIIKRELESSEGYNFILPSSILPTSSPSSSSLSSQIGGADEEEARIPGNFMLGSLEVFWQNLMHDGKEERITDQKISINDGQNNATSIPAKERPMMNLEHHIIPSVTSLKECGVEFRCKKTLPFWHVEFKGGVLEIPQIMIHKSTESIFLNVMAYELRRVATEDCKITSYVLFMDSLVNSALDVAELRDCGIIVGAGPSDKEIADLFNGLGKRVFIPLNQFGELSKRINEYCHQPIHKWRANLMHNYFNSPWSIFSVIAAVTLLVLTFLQTGYTMLQYHAGP